MKTRKFLAVLLLVAMSLSFMAVSASAEGSVITVVETDDNSGEAVIVGGAGSDAGEDDDVLVIEGSAGGDEGEDAVTPMISLQAASLSTKPAVSAASFEELIQALKDVDENGTVNVTADIESSDKYIAIVKPVTLNLGGHSITLNAGANAKNWAAISVECEGNVTVTNGSIVVNEITDSSSGTPVTYKYGNGINNSKGANLILRLTVSYKGDGTLFNGKNITADEGKYSADPAGHVGSENEIVDNGDGSFTVKAKSTAPDYAFSIGENKYKTLGEALAAAKDGDVLVMADKYISKADVKLNKNLTIDMGGKKLSLNSIEVPTGKSLTLKNGTLEASLSSAGSLTLAEGAVVGDITVQSGFHCDADDVLAGSVTVADHGKVKISISAGRFVELNKGTDTIIEGNVTGGKFQTEIDSVFLAKGYELKFDEESKFYVVSKIADATLTGPAEMDFIEGNAPEAGMALVSSVPVKEVYSGELKSTNELESPAEFTLSADKKTVTLTQAYLNVCKSGEHTIIVVTEDGVNTPSVKFNVLERPAIKVDGKKAEHVLKSEEELKFIANYDISSPQVDGKALADADAEMNGKNISLKAAYLNGLALGKYTLRVNTVHGFAQIEFEIVEKSTVPVGKVTGMDGKEVGRLEYFKHGEGKNNNEDMKFKTEPEISALYINGSKLTESSDYTKNKDSLKIAKDADFLEKLPAGKNVIKFVHENGAEEEFTLYVSPVISLKPERHVLGSGKDAVLSLSDAPTAVVAGTSTNAIDLPDLSSENYSANGNEFTIKGSYLDKRDEGTFYIGARYDNYYVLRSIKIVPAPSVKPTDDNKDAKWSYGSSNLSFAVSPDVKEVKVGGTTITDKNYSVSDKNILTLKSGYLKTLAYGTHTLTVLTTDGEASTEFITKCGIEAADGNLHTKGGKKDLKFVCSDKISKAYVGTVELKSEEYTLSDDGKTITLKAAFLNKLKADSTYTLKVVTEGGCNAFAGFKILSPGSAGTSPKTGDNGGIFLWSALLILSGAAAVILLPRKKEQ